jgi:hypothetical protein
MVAMLSAPHTGRALPHKSFSIHVCYGLNKLWIHGALEGLGALKEDQ